MKALLRDLLVFTEQSKSKNRTLVHALASLAARRNIYIISSEMTKGRQKHMTENSIRILKGPKRNGINVFFAILKVLKRVLNCSKGS